MDLDWARAIKRNSEALKGIVAELFAMLGLAGEATVSRIPQPLHRAVLRVLRPAESAVRRLIIIAARGLVVKLKPAAIASHAGGDHREGWRSRPVPPSSSSIRGKTSQSCASTAESSCAIPLASISTRMIPCGQRPSHSRSRFPARWPGECRTPHPEAPGPQAGARGSAAPGQASRPLAGEAGEHAKSEVQVTAQAGSSTRPPQEDGSRSR